MKLTLKLEELGIALASWGMTLMGGWGWWWWPALWVVPDLSMLGYVFGSKVGALCYNAVHHRGLAMVIVLVGFVFHWSPVQLAGWILLGHSSIDRFLGYGLKHSDSFQHTHLGWIGKIPKNASDDPRPKS